MSENYITPTPESVTSLLAMIYGDDLGTTIIEVSDVNGSRIATFINDEDKLVAICICNLEFVIFSGAALSMIPSATAADMVAENSVSEVIGGNFHEVMNICTKLFMSDTSAHLRLQQTLEFDQGAEILGRLETFGEQLAFAVGIPGYGEGRIAIYIA